MDEDISVKMYKRACNSYGIESANTNTVEDQRLAKLWAWFSSILLNFSQGSHLEFHYKNSFVLLDEAHYIRFCANL